MGSSLCGFKASIPSYDFKLAEDEPLARKDAADYANNVRSSQCRQTNARRSGRVESKKISFLFQILNIVIAKRHQFDWISKF